MSRIIVSALLFLRCALSTQLEFPVLQLPSLDPPITNSSSINSFTQSNGWPPTPFTFPVTSYLSCEIVALKAETPDKGPAMLAAIFDIIRFLKLDHHLPDVVYFTNKHFGPLLLSVYYSSRKSLGPPWITREQLLKLLDIIADRVVADGPVSIWEAILDDGTYKSDFELKWKKTDPPPHASWYSAFWTKVSTIAILFDNKSALWSRYNWNLSSCLKGSSLISQRYFTSRNRYPSNLLHSCYQYDLPRQNFSESVV